ncbi:MAG: sigma-70 family RNA polymerase sigma factor [Bacteroidetes bacterium]|nr:sigma-70 family RNA polymerase sigma factor [Bacteroidota bacterium]
MEATKNITTPAQWIEQYADTLFKFAVSRVGDTETAKDLVQETFLSALKNTTTFRGEISEKNWLFTILKNKIIDYYRSKAKQSFTELKEHLEEAENYFDSNDWNESAKPKEWGIDYSQNIETKEFYEVLEKCKQKLAELQNAVFTLKYMEDKNSEDICKELGISPSNYWVLLHRAKLQLRQCLEKNWFLK